MANPVTSQPNYRFLTSPRSVYVHAEGHEPVEISVEQLTPAAIARMFSIDPGSVWLREENGSRVFFPDGTKSSFMLPEDIGNGIDETLIAMGSMATCTHASSQSNTNTSRIISANIGGGTPSTSQSSSHPLPIRKQSTANVKVVQAHFKRLSNGRTEFTPLNQTFVEVAESTANIHYVTSAVQRRWGAEYTLVTSDGLRVDDSAEGLKFWKVGSRKVYAVKDTELGDNKRKVRGGVTSSESEDFLPRVKRRRVSLNSEKLDKINTDLSEVKSELSELFKVTSTLSIPIPMRRLLRDSFRCLICQSTPMRPPIIFSRCCKVIIGCQSCIDLWYRGEEGQQRTCPNCREPRAYAETTKVNGLDDFLVGIAELLQSEEE